MKRRFAREAIIAVLPLVAIGVVLFGASAGTATSSASFTVSGAALSPSGPITITTGGTYSGSWTSTGSTPSVRISTTQPVTITNSSIQNLSGGELVHADAGANVTITHSTFQGGNGRAFYALRDQGADDRQLHDPEDHRHPVRRRGAAATITVTRNRVRNIQSGPIRPSSCSSPTSRPRRRTSPGTRSSTPSASRASRTTSTCTRPPTRRFTTTTSRARIRRLPAAASPGSGIMIDYLGSHDNEVYANQVVDTTNAGIGIAGGWNNKVHDNRMIFDGKLDDGTPLARRTSGSTCGTCTTIPAGRTTPPTTTPSAGSTLPGAATTGGPPIAPGTARTRPPSGDQLTTLPSRRSTRPGSQSSPRMPLWWAGRRPRRQLGVRVSEIEPPAFVIPSSMPSRMDATASPSARRGKRPRSRRRRGRSTDCSMADSASLAAELEVEASERRPRSYGRVSYARRPYSPGTPTMPCKEASGAENWLAK